MWPFSWFKARAEARARKRLFADIADYVSEELRPKRSRRRIVAVDNPEDYEMLKEVKDSEAILVHQPFPGYEVDAKEFLLSSWEVDKLREPPTPPEFIGHITLNKAGEFIFVGADYKEPKESK